jgi:acetyl-CoA acetyltransferase
MTSDDNVYIVGLGLHPFGRHPGVTGLDMGVRAVKNALEDAGVAWNHIDFAVGGSNTAKPDALVGRLGLTGVAFASVRNGCATGGVALATAANALRAGWFRQARTGGVQQRRGLLWTRSLVPAFRPHGHHPILRDARAPIHV